ncbi:hypothetical protein EI94DRAFT_1751120, partial [Lactarius quietus]
MIKCLRALASATMCLCVNGILPHVVPLHTMALSILSGGINCIAFDLNLLLLSAQRS